MSADFKRMVLIPEVEYIRLKQSEQYKGNVKVSANINEELNERQRQMYRDQSNQQTNASGNLSAALNSTNAINSTQLNSTLPF